MTDKKRRQFVTMMGAGAAVVPLSALVGSLPSHAQDDLPLVEPDSAQATALQYVEASEVEGQNCANCSLWQGGDAEQGPCPLFPGMAVKAEGWCSAYVPMG